MPPSNKITPPGKTQTVVPQPDQAPNTAHPVPALVSSPPPTPPKAAKSRRKPWLWAASAVVAAALAALLYLQPWLPDVAQVTTETLVAGPVTRVLAVNGRIAGVQSVDVRPQVSGTLTAIDVDEGGLVTSGQTLAHIDSSAQQAAVRQALAGLDSALVSKAESQATLVRTMALGNNATRVLLETATTADQVATQEVARTTALLEQGQIQLEKYTIRAPIAGTILVSAADPGQNVDPTTLLMTIADMRRLVVETDVDESYATQIRTDQPAALQLSGEATVRQGHVSFVSQRVDAATGGLAVKLAPDAPLVAPIGLTVTANITVDDRPSALTVPRAAIVSGADGDAVFVLADDTAQRRAVKVIDWPAARLIITQGLSEGDVVIIDATGIADGQIVTAAP